MPGTRGRRPAFTLTEILMAVGVLGVGLTMVASIFPVAVDQSRRSREITQAAFCARSASAMIRVLRNDLATWRRAWGGVLYSIETDHRLPGRLKVYDPAEFLYEGESRSYKNTGTWAAGHYVPRVYLTPVSENGPWRVTLVIYRSQGEPPPSIVWSEQWPQAWAKMGPGKYILDPTNYDGYAYMVDSIKGENPGDVTLATRGRAENTEHAESGWRCMVDAVAVYHTVLGD